MPDAIQITITDVINRLHHVKGEDRFSILMEHMETLIFADEDADEILWVEPQLIKEEEK